MAGIEGIDRRIGKTAGFPTGSGFGAKDYRSRVPLSPSLKRHVSGRQPQKQPSAKSDFSPRRALRDTLSVKLWKDIGMKNCAISQTRKTASGSFNAGRLI